MKKVNTYVHVYRLQFEATTVNLNIIENFIDAGIDILFTQTKLIKHQRQYQK